MARETLAVPGDQGDVVVVGRDQEAARLLAEAFEMLQLAVGVGTDLGEAGEAARQAVRLVHRVHRVHRQAGGAERREERGLARMAKTHDQGRLR